MESTPEPGDTSRATTATRRDDVSATCLIVALDSARPLDAPSRHWLIDIDEVSIGRSPRRRSAERRPAERRPDRPRMALRVPDALVSARHATLCRNGNAWVLEDLRSTNQTFVNGVAIDRRALADGDVIAIGGTFLVFRAAVLPRAPDSETLDDMSHKPEGVRTVCPELECRFADLTRIARSMASIVILGHTGTGKELAAQAIHHISDRRSGPFVAINCGSIPGSLLEGELFGHTKGAFTGATQDREGLLAAAEHGTLFLDEIGDLSLPMQASLLRVLQSGELRPLGSARQRRLDLRVVAATNRDLPAMVRKGGFRDDLWARLNGFTLRLPDLRNRREDLGLLLSNLLRRHAGDAPRTFSTPAAAALFAHDWPFNVRELDKALEHALALAPGGEIDLDHLPATVVAPSAGPEHDRRRELVALLRKHAGNIAEVAREMGKHRQQVQKWCKRFQIDVDALRPATYRDRPRS